MAGSQTEQSKFTDPALAARVEVIRMLADQLREPVAVIDRSWTITYANQSAFAGGWCRVPDDRPRVGAAVMA